MEEKEPPPLEYAKRGAPEQRIADPNDSPTDRWVLVIVASFVVFAGVMYAGARILLSWEGWDIPRRHWVFIATVATLLSAATAAVLKPR